MKKSKISAKQIKEIIAMLHDEFQFYSKRGEPDNADILRQIEERLKAHSKGEK